MSNLILPPGISLPKTIRPRENPIEDASQEEKATQLPDPTGWKLLWVVPDVEKTFENSSIVKADP